MKTLSGGLIFASPFLAVPDRKRFPSRLEVRRPNFLLDFSRSFSISKNSDFNVISYASFSTSIFPRFCAGYRSAMFSGFNEFLGL